MDEDEVQVSTPPISEGETYDQSVVLDDIKASIDAVKVSVDGVRASVDAQPGQSEDMSSVLVTLDKILAFLEDRMPEASAANDEVIEASDGEPLEIVLDGSEGGEASEQVAGEVYEYTEYETYTLDALQYNNACLTVIIGMFVALAVYKFLRVFF